MFLGLFFFSLPIFCNTQTTVENQYFSAMKKRITTWNSAQTWVTLSPWHTGYPWFVQRPSSAYRAKTWKRMICHRQVYWDDCEVVWIFCTTLCSRRAARHEAQYREFALLDHSRSSSLGLRTLRAENQHSGFYELTLLIWYFSSIAKFISQFVVPEKNGI